MTRSPKNLFPIFLFLFFAACHAEPTSNKGASGEKKFFKILNRPVAVTPYTTQAREIPLVITQTGRTEAIDRFEAKAPSTARILKIFVEEGAKVQAGDPLIKYNDDEIKLRLTRARAEIKEAEAAISDDNYMIKNREKLMAEEKLSELVNEGLDGKLTLHQATLERAKTDVDLYDKVAELEQVNSPIPGLVTKKTVSDGAEVQAEQVLLEVVRFDPIQFVFPAPIEAVSALEKGAEIAIHVVGFSRQEFTGEVLSVVADSQANGSEVKIKIPNPDFTLKPDMPGDVVVRTQAKRKVFPVPETALFKTEHSTYVFKIEGDKVKKIPVDLGEPYNSQPAIIKGITEGDIIASSAEGLQDGSLIEVQKPENK